MQWLGLSTTALLGAFGAFGAAVVALYLLKLRRRQVVVPYVALWSKLLAEKKSSALWSRLKRWLSLLVALAIVGLLVAALGDPRRPFEGRGRTLVILVDASASMQAEDVPGGRARAARAQARNLVGGLEAFDRALVAQLDDGVTPLSTLTDDRTALRAAVGRVRATDLSADLGRGIAYALDVLAGAAEGEIVLVSDGGARHAERAEALLDTEGAPGFRYVRVGEGDAPNLGITAFSVRRYPLDKTQSEVLLRARNYTDAPVTATLTLSAEGVMLHRQTLELEAEADAQVVLRNVPGADRTLTARLEAESVRDALSADDVAYARLPERQRMRVLLVSEGNRYLEAALLLDEYLEVEEATPGAQLPGDDYDVVVYDGWLPPRPPATAALYILPAEPAPGYSPLKRTGTLERPFVGKVLEDHPITRFSALRDTNIGAAAALQTQRGDRAVVRSEQGEPLLVTGEREGQPFVALAFDPRLSDLPMRVAWPLLVLGTLEFLAGESADYASSYRAGEAWELRVPEGIEQLRVGAPDGTSTRVRVADGQASFTAERAGIYTLTAPGYDDVAAVSLADPAEGELAVPEAVAKAPPETVAPSAGTSTRLLWPWLVAIALFLLAVEWLTFHRRWTV